MMRTITDKEYLETLCENITDDKSMSEFKFDDLLKLYYDKLEDWPALPVRYITKQADVSVSLVKASHRYLELLQHMIECPSELYDVCKIHEHVCDQFVEINEMPSVLDGVDFGWVAVERLKFLCAIIEQWNNVHEHMCNDIWKIDEMLHVLEDFEDCADLANYDRTLSALFGLFHFEACIKPPVSGILLRHLVMKNGGNMISAPELFESVRDKHTRFKTISEILDNHSKVLVNALAIKTIEMHRNLVYIPPSAAKKNAMEKDITPGS